MQLRLILLLALLFNVDILDAAKKKKKPKPSKKPAKKPAVNPSPGGGAGDCGISVELGNTWNQGQDGILKIKFPKAVKKWTIELVYDKPVKTLTFFEGKESGSGKKFTVKNENWNGVNKAGSSLDLRYQKQFSDSNVPPKLTSLKFNGKQCSLGGAGGTGGTTLSPGKTSGAPTKTTASSGGKTSTTGRTTVVPGGKTSTTGRTTGVPGGTTVTPGGTKGTPGGKTTWSGGATHLMTSETPQDTTASPEVTTSAPPGCTFRGVSIAVGSRLPLPAKCSWLVCSALTMGGSTVASMDLEGKQGCNCCLGDDGDMYADGETHYLENGEKTACYMGNWIVILPPNPVGTTIIPGGTTENVEGTDFTTPAHVGSTGEGMTPAPGGTTPPSKVTTPAQGGTTQSTGGGGTHCGISVELGNTWNQGQDGKLKIKFPSTVSTWAIELIYDNPLNSISFYTAKERGSGKEFTIKNEDWNGANPAGAVLDLGYQIQFPQSNVPPKITSIKFNGKECSLGGGGGIGGGATTASIGHTTPYPAGTSGAPGKTSSAPAASTPSVTAAPCTTNGTKYDYGEVLRLSNLFYQAQRSGPLDVLGDFNHNLIPYRGDSALEDGSDNGVDLSGGYYDAGDYVKFNFPMAAATTLIGWGATDFQEGYETTSQHEDTLNTIRWTTDYLIKCHSDPEVFWAQVGDGNADHAEWDRVEDMTIPRPSYKLDKNNPGSDLAGESAAALAAASIAFKDKDPDYSAELLSHAKAYFDFADKYRGKYSDSVPNAASFYNSWSGYNDELVWGAAWLYKATGDIQYLEKAESLYQDKNANEFSWDDKTAGAQVLLAQLTGKPKYVSKAKAFCDKMVDQQAKTPKGMVWIQQWGPLRHASNVAFICLEVASIDDSSIDGDKYRQFAMDQIHYALGDTGRSFVIGFGEDFPKKPHHRSSSCPKNPSEQCGWDALNNPGPNPSTLWGALVGGPGQDDSYEDKRDDYIKNEVACDYNAGFQSAVAGLRTLADQGLLPSHTCPAQGSAGGGSSEGGSSGGGSSGGGSSGGGSSGGGSSGGGSSGGGSGPVSVTAGPGVSGGEDKVTAYGDAWQGNNCGFIKMPSAHAETYFVAMPNDYYNAGATCGVCVKLSTNEKSLIVYGMNRCPECHYHVPGESHWDLSNSAYRFLIGEPLGIGSDLTHEIVPCPENVVAGNMQIFTKDGSNPYWNAFQPVNFRIKVEGMSLSTDGGNSWSALRGPGEHYVDGFYYLNDSINLSGSYKLRVHSASGDIDVDMTGVQAKSFVDTGKQN